MEINWSIVGWLAAVIFVYIFGIFEGRGQGRKRRITEEQEEKEKQPASPPETIKVDDPGLLRIKNENGALTLDLDGTHVDAPSLSPNQRKRLIEILNLTRPWLDVKPAASAAAPKSMPDPSFESRLNAISVPPHAPPMPVPVQSTAPTSSSVSAQDKSATPIPSKKKDEKPESTPTSMVGQINTILQLRIANTPLSSQGVTIMESTSGGVIVYVGINKYEGIEDVPNEDVKAAIRAAIAEWEKKYTPGLS